MVQHFNETAYWQVHNGDHKLSAHLMVEDLELFEWWGTSCKWWLFVRDYPSQCCGSSSSPSMLHLSMCMGCNLGGVCQTTSWGKSSGSQFVEKLLPAYRSTSWCCYLFFYSSQGSWCWHLCLNYAVLIDVSINLVIFNQRWQIWIHFGSFLKLLIGTVAPTL